MRILTGLGTTAEVCAALDQEGAMPVAGGTAVSLLLRQGLIRPRILVALDGVRALRRVASEDGGIRLGAAVSLRRIETSDSPLLSAAARSVANVRLRNMATLGGSLCEADPDSDVPTALLALGAIVRVAGPSGTRDVPLEGFWRGPYEVDLAPGEIVESVWVPWREGPAAYRRFTAGPPGERPLVCVAVSGRVAAVGGASAVPYRVEAPPEDLPAAAAAAADPVDDPRAPAWYRRHLVAELVRRALRSGGIG